MLKVKDLVPDIYYEESRDFQVFGRSFEVIFNYLKTNVDLVSENPVDARSSDLLIRLVTKTLGFESKHEYDIDNLRTLCCLFMRCLRKKGTKQSIEDAIQGLLNVQGIDSGFVVRKSSDPNSNHTLDIYLPVELRDVVLLEDLFDYILPAGILYNFIYGDYGFINEVKTKMLATDEVDWAQYQDMNLGTVLNAEVVPARTSYDNIGDESTLAQTYTGTVATPEQQEEEEQGE